MMWRFSGVAQGVEGQKLSKQLSPQVNTLFALDENKRKKTHIITPCVVNAVIISIHLPACLPACACADTSQLQQHPTQHTAHI